LVPLIIAHRGDSAHRPENTLASFESALAVGADLIELDVGKRALNLKVPEDELARRRAAWKQPARKFERSYGAIFSRHVRQADEGCDFDFLLGTEPLPEPEIH